jgi:mannose-6-phosphate isomerase-like protein (cupin superfamily)
MLIGKFGDIEILSASANVSTLNDGRGGIFTWIPQDDIKEFNLLYFNQGIVRGNHYHPEFTEYFLIISGAVTLFTEVPGTEERINMLCGEGTLIRSKPFVPHAIHAVTNAVCMSLITKPWDECEIPIVYKDLV